MMTRDQAFLITFAKLAAIFTYIMFHGFLVGMTVLTIVEPPAWLEVTTHSPASWAILAFMFGLVFINFMFIPIAISLAKHEAMETQRKQLIYYAHRGIVERSTTEEPMKFFQMIEKDENHDA